MKRWFLILLALVLMAGCAPPDPEPTRVALFNIRELSTEKITETDAEGVGQNAQLRAAAAIIQTYQPDILILNEIDHDYAHSDDLARNARAFAAAYLNHGEDAISYPYAFAAPCNTGLLSGMDLDHNGAIATAADEGTREHGNDSFGFGVYPGQYSMAVLSKHPIDAAQVRTFQTFLWKDLPNHHIPTDYYTASQIEGFRLSSKSHWDVPVQIGEDVVHLLVSHPTPPVFDGPEDRNGRRNFDEVKFWAHYLNNDAALYDDAGQRGGVAAEASFIIAGDLNASTRSTESGYDGQLAIETVLTHPRVQESGPWLTSAGAVAENAAGAPEFYERSTVRFGNGGYHRIDYLLPSTDVEIVDGGVYWPAATADSTGHAQALAASDHRFLWLDIVLSH